MILIADSGSTKTDWVLVDRDKNQSYYHTIGYNPYFVDSETIYDSLSKKLINQFDPSCIKKVLFYGAGCSQESKSNVVNNALTKCFTNAEIIVDHDMLAAARALLGDQRGFAAILGTGSNTCIYDGKQIEKNIDSLGYLLGDEGSGSYIAKKIIRDFMRGRLPGELQEKFQRTYNLTNSNIFDALYNGLAPNKFLAGFCKFADQNRKHKYIRRVVKESFNDFFKNLVRLYPDYQKFKFNCAGSVGSIFKDQLKEVAAAHGMQMGVIMPSPIINLVNYHTK